ncbi:hypothetical protein SAMN05421856_101121 [Chryseobacterium taichungense]|uniref:Uncharacterized protein n=1 Tax=Chryseobacterium taichungense TaxID=295069 RepID=A0A1H7VMF3_9FLAO|nr:hypothetical protein SAMN05421856_101121 [Chryseobacterium taichungense]
MQYKVLKLTNNATKKPPATAEGLLSLKLCDYYNFGLYPDWLKITVASIFRKS